MKEKDQMREIRDRMESILLPLEKAIRLKGLNPDEVHFKLGLTDKEIEIYDLKLDVYKCIFEAEAIEIDDFKVRIEDLSDYENKVMKFKVLIIDVTDEFYCFDYITDNPKLLEPIAAYFKKHIDWLMLSDEDQRVLKWGLEEDLRNIDIFTYKIYPKPNLI
jgi:hypothetical protein